MIDANQRLTPRTWPVGTQVTLTNVKWDATYRDIVAFDTTDERDAYFNKLTRNGKTWRSDKFSYLRVGEPVTLPVPYSTAYAYNYLVVTNPMQPVDMEGPARTLYYFITGITYENPQSVTVTLQLDVIMTYQFDICLGNMFVESGHVAVSNSAIPDRYADLSGQDLRHYLTVPEGIDIGSEYVMCNREWYPMVEADTRELGRVIVVSAANLAADPGTVDQPIMNVADGQSADNIPSACNVYSMHANTFKQFMLAMQNYSWVAQSIISVSSFPARLLSAGPEVELFGKTGIMMNFLGETDSMTDTVTPYIETPNIFTQLSNGVPQGFEKYMKFYTYPYSVIEIGSFSGNSVFIKPELVQGNTVSIYAIGCAMSPFARVGIFPRNYGLPDAGAVPPDNTFTYLGMGDRNPYTGVIPSGDFLDTCLWLGDFPQFSIVNNSYITYMASTAHTRQYNYSAAGWANSRASEAANLGYNQATAALQTNQSNYDSSLQGLGANAANRAWTSPVLEDVGGITTGSLQQGLAATGASGFGWNASNIVNNLTGLTQQQNNQALGYYNADTNKQYADWANAGDYRNAIAGIEATVQDAALQPPSVAGQMGGQGFMWKNGLVGFSVTYKTISGSQARAVADMWARYGYKVHRFVNFGMAPLKNLKVMSKFSYWQVLETYLTCASANESEIAAIRGILEKGVTIWGDPDDIGNTPVTSNQPLRNISY